MKSVKTRAIASLTVLIMIMSLVGCGGGGAGEEETAPEADKDYAIVAAVSASVLTLDPAMHRDRTTETILRNMFDGSGYPDSGYEDRA